MQGSSSESIFLQLKVAKLWALVCTTQVMLKALSTLGCRLLPSSFIGVSLEEEHVMHTSEVKIPYFPQRHFLLQQSTTPYQVNNIFNYLIWNIFITFWQEKKKTSFAHCFPSFAVGVYKTRKTRGGVLWAAFPLGHVQTPLCAATSVTAWGNPWRQVWRWRSANWP